MSAPAAGALDLPQLVPGATPPPALPAAPGLSALPVGVAEVAGALLVVIALLLVTLGLLRRLAAPRLGPYPLKVLGSVAVGPRERLVTVAVADTILLLGVGGGGGVRILHTLPAPPGAARAADPAPPGAADGFAARLRALRARPPAPAAETPDA